MVTTWWPSSDRAKLSLSHPSLRIVTGDVLGGAGSLRISGGRLLWDTEGLPEPLRRIMHASGGALDEFIVDERFTVGY